MAGIDVTASFRSIDEIAESYFKAGNIRVNPDVSKSSSTEDSCYGIDDVFSAMSEEGDYSMLQLTLKFMHNLHPADLYMFFDELSFIEKKLFQKYGIDYSEIEKEYNKDRTMLENSYINFAIKYHNEVTAILFKEETQYTTQQMKFIVNRNKTLLDVLPQIGTKISRNYYEDYVINDNPGEFGD